jgi:DNA-binding beta-propeller fold protein YncE
MKILLRAFFIFAFFLTCAPQIGVAESVKFESEIKENLSAPLDLALSGDGNLFVLDAAAAIQSFDPENKPQISFKIPAAAGSSVPTSILSQATIALSPKGQLVMADIVNNHISVFGLGGELLFGFGEPGNLSGQFQSLSSVDVDGLGFIYASESANKRIQIFTPNGIFMRAIALSGAAVDVTVDQRGNIYALLPKEGIIEKFNNEGQKISAIACRSSNVDQIAKTSRLHVDPWGDIYLTQSSDERIVKIDPSGKVLITFGSPGDARGQFSGISGLIADETGRLYVADKGNSRIQIFKMLGLEKNPLPKLSSVPFFLDFESTVEAQEGVLDVFFRPGKGLFSVSDKKGSVNVWDHPELVIGGDGSGAGQLLKPAALFVTLDGKIYVADSGNNRVSIFNSDGTFLYEFGKNGNKPGQFNSPQGIAVNGKGIIYVADTLNNRIQVFNHDGIYLSEFGDLVNDAADQCQKVKLPKAIAVDSKDNIYVLDAENYQVKVFDDKGECLEPIGAKGTGFGQFTKPIDIAIDQNDNLYVADAADARVQIFDMTGRFLLSFGSPGTGGGYFRQLSSIAASEGNIYVADYQNKLIQVFKYSPDGLIGRAERLYATNTAPPPPGKDSNDVLRYTQARKIALRDSIDEFVESLGFSETYLARFVRIESVESLNDGKVKVTVSIPKYIPKEILPAENSGSQSGGS